MSTEAYQHWSVLSTSKLAGLHFLKLLLCLLWTIERTHQFVLPRQAYALMLVCAFGACDADPDPTEQKCICKPTMTVEMPQQETRHPTCNNATFDWMMQTLLTEVSAQKDHILEQNEKIEKLQKQLERYKQMNNKFVREDSVLQDLEIQNIELQEMLENSQRREANVVSEFKARNAEQEMEIEELKEKVKKTETSKHREKYPRDCSDIQNRGTRYSGIYTVYPSDNSDDGLQVFCDLNTDNGGWMLIQRRQDGSEKFDKTWDEYKKGFGQIAREFWIGNENLHAITTAASYELRIELQAFDGEFKSANYDFFSVESEENNYTLTLGKYTGDSGDAMTKHNGQPFSTHDRDNDLSRSGNCSKLYGYGGWWFDRCYDANLNGVYYQDGRSVKQGISWFQWREFESLRHVEMKIRAI